jgi:outer membrane lipoprotein-sorting protein
MFKPISTAILCAIALSSVPLIGQEAGLTLDQIIQKHIDAEGGADKINAVQTMKATGTASLMGGQLEAPITVVVKRPSSMRLEMSIQGKSLIQAFDGTTAWMINPLMGSADPQKSNDEDTQSMKEDSDFVGGPLYDYKTKGNTVELIGKEDVEGSPAYKIKVTKKSGNVQNVYLDAQTFLTIRTTGRRKQMGQELDLEINHGNYKPVNGVMVPFSIDQKNAGKSMMNFTLEKVEMNVPADDSIFSMPEKPKPTDKDKSPEKP